MTSRDRGTWGEALVADYLRKHGCTLLASQWRCRLGEIDLIARRRGVMCFVEVKLRSGTAYGLPREFVDRRKQEKLHSAAALYLSRQELDCPVRFDVAEVYWEEGRKPRIEYIENAF